MSISILHISDLHFREPLDKALAYPELLVDSCTEHVRRTSQFVIAVTGDIVFSGQEREYQLAEQFFSVLREAFIARDCVKPVLVMVPGNHDCVLVPKDDIRSIVIDRIIADPATAASEDVISTCVKPQQNFFSFRNRISDITPVYDHPLWTEYEVLSDGKVVRLSAINAAWMSRLPEPQGQLVFPAKRFEHIITQPAELRIGLIHHPLNWYAQASYHELRRLMRSHCSAVLSGHEHTTAVGDVSETGLGKQLYLEADALQPHGEGETPGFSLAVFDVVAESAQVIQFEIQPPKAFETKRFAASLRRLSHAAAEAPSLTPSFVERISDPGGTFIHPDRSDLDLDDIFVFPELRRLNGSNGSQRIEPLLASDSVLLESPSDSRSIVLSEEKGGKTSLLYMLFKKLHSMGYWPLYFSMSRSGIKSVKNFPRAIESLAAEQYANPRTFLSAPTHKRIALIDDLDNVKGGSRGLHQFLEQIVIEFSGSVATAPLGFQLEELIQPRTNLADKPFHFFEILKFGHSKRHTLIRKWCGLGALNTAAELDRDVHGAEDLLNSVLGKNLASSLPIYLLILLQSWSQGQQGEIQNSSFARYYEYLMTRSLVKAGGLERDEYDELFNYLSQLAWFYWDRGIEAASHSELVGFNGVFCQRFTTVDLSRRIDLLIDARLLRKVGGEYEFAYPYVFYFFVGRWLARNLESEGVKEKVEECCRELDLRRNGSTVLFLSYHSNDRWIIETVARRLAESMPECDAINLCDDIDFINGLADSSSKVLIDPPDVEKNQTRAREIRDDLDSVEEDDEGSGDSQDIEEEDIMREFRKLTLLFKTAEILAQIIKNYYGSLERSVKEENLDQVIEAPLRVLRRFLELVGNDQDGFVEFIEKEIIEGVQNNQNVQDKRMQARRIAYRLLGLLATGFILRVSAWVGSRRIEEDVKAVIEKNSTVARRLVLAGSRLVLPGEVPHEQIKGLARDLRDNPFAFGILQSMGVRYIHLFFVPHRDRQKLCDTLRIEFKSSQFIDLSTKDTKLIGKH